MAMPKTQGTAKALEWGSPTRFLKGVGPEKQKLLERLELEVLADLFYFFPRRYEKRFPVKKVSELTFLDKECVVGTVSKCGMRYSRTTR